MTWIVLGKSRADVVNIANEQLVRVFSWLTNNKLIANTAKTKYVVFSPKSCNTKTKYLWTCDIQLQLANVAISEVDNFRFLGVIVSKESFPESSHALCSKQTPRMPGTSLWIFDNLTRSCMLTLFFAFAYSHLNYCISTRCTTNFCLCDSLQRYCNKILRIIFFRDSGSKLGWHI